MWSFFLCYDKKCIRDIKMGYDISTNNSRRAYASFSNSRMANNNSSPIYQRLVQSIWTEKLSHYNPLNLGRNPQPKAEHAFQHHPHGRHPSFVNWYLSALSPAYYILYISGFRGTPGNIFEFPFMLQDGVGPLKNTISAHYNIGLV